MPAHPGHLCRHWAATVGPDTVREADMTWRKTMPLSDLIAQATQKRDEAFGRNISNSRKVFSKYHPC
jgi:hypothetical protein